MRLNTFILHQVHKTVRFCLSNLPTISTGTATFCLIMNKPFDICHECQQHTDLTRKFKPFLPTNDSRFLWLKYQVLLYFEVWLKTTEVRPGVCEKSEKQKMFISSQICKECIKINLHTVIEQAYTVFDFA